MKKPLLFLFFTFALSASVNPGLLEYQKKYSLCKGKTNYQIAQCLVNGNLNYAPLRGDRSVFRTISSKKINTALRNGTLYSMFPNTQRYNKLKTYQDHLYAIKSEYTAPRFNGNSDEDIIRMKRVFNLLQNSGLAETPERTANFDTALRTYQSRHSLTVDGKIGRRTKETLKQSISTTILKVKKNLTWERISRKKPSTFVRVNIPEFKMHYYENGKHVLKMRVVVGKTKMRTPVFYRKMNNIVQNPTWNVPSSIYKKEYAHLSASALKKKGLVYNASGKLYQPAGSRNALGKVKFLFPNKYSVYMHDTPAKGLFGRTTRAYSHGCIRLAKPMSLLQKLGYTYKPGKTKWTTLKKKIPVYVVYHTAWVDDKGIVKLSPDIYGYEKTMFTKPVRRAKPKHKAKRKPVYRDAISEF